MLYTKNFALTLDSPAKDIGIETTLNHVKNIANYIQDNCLDKALEYANKNRLIFINKSVLTARQQKGIISFVLADLFEQQNKFEQAAKYYTSYLGFASDIPVDNAGNQLAYAAHLAIGIIDFKNGDFENTIFHLRRIAENSAIKLDWSEEVYCKLLMTQSLIKIDQTKEASVVFKNIMPLKDVEISIVKNDGKGVCWNVGFSNLGTLALRNPLNAYQNILNDVIKEKNNRAELIQSFINQVAKDNLQGLALTKNLQAEQKALLRWSFILMRLYARKAFHDNKIVAIAALNLATLCPQPRNLEEAVCLAEGFVVNEQYVDSVKLLIPFIKTQADAEYVFLKSEMQAEKQDYKTKDDYKYIFFFHLVNFAKQFLKEKQFKFPEIANYSVGFHLTSNIGHPNLSLEEKDQMLVDSSKYLKLALSSNKLPKYLFSEATSEISFNKQVIKGFPILKKNKGELEISFKVDRKNKD